MNKRKTLLFFTLILTSILLSACAGGLSGSSWPGISVNGDSIYLANMSHVYALRPSDGSMIWRFPAEATQATFFAEPVLADGQLIVGDYKNILHSLNPATGAENWSFEAKGQWIASPLVMDGIIYAPNADQNLYVLDKTGNILWTFTADRALWSQPVGNGDTIYLAAMDHNLYALDKDTGNRKWVTDLGGAVVYSPTLSPDGVIYVANLAREVIAIDSTDGEILWRRKFEESLWTQPAIQGDRLYFGDLAGNVYAVSVTDGSDIWTQTLNDPVTGKPTVLDDAIIFSTENGTLVAMNQDGERLWSKTVQGKLYTGPVPMDDRFLIGIALGDSPILMINASGQDVWNFIPPK